jgi:uncharacterized membrane protein YedE/YeeE
MAGFTSPLQGEELGWLTFPGLRPLRRTPCWAIFVLSLRESACGAILAGMHQFTRQFDHRKSAPNPQQILRNICGQIILLALGAFTFGIWITLLARTMRTGDPYMVGNWQKLGIAASALLVLGSAIFIRRGMRQLGFSILIP